MAYRLSRNVEASIIDYITAQLTADGLTGIYTEKVFAEVYNGHFPCILVGVSDRPDVRRELGGNSLSNYVDVEIRIFATSDGSRLDLSDWILSKMMGGVAYYNYTITNGVVSAKVLAGRISVLEIAINRKELKNTDNLAKEDRYRHLLNFRCRVALT